MPVNGSSSPQSAADPVRMHAATLFAAAARTTADVDGAARLHCLAAYQELTDAVAEHGPPPDVAATGTGDGRDAVALVRDALTLLGSLPLEQFAARDVRDAAVHGRRALRRLP